MKKIVCSTLVSVCIKLNAFCFFIGSDAARELRMVSDRHINGIAQALHARMVFTNSYDITANRLPSLTGTYSLVLQAPRGPLVQIRFCSLESLCSCTSARAKNKFTFIPYSTFAYIICPTFCVMSLLLFSDLQMCDVYHNYEDRY